LSSGVSVIIFLNSSSSGINSPSSPKIISLITSAIFLTSDGKILLVFSFASPYNSSSLFPIFSANSLVTMLVYNPLLSTPTFHRYIIAKSSNSLCGTFSRSSLFCSAFTNVKIIFLSTLLKSNPLFNGDFSKPSIASLKVSLNASITPSKSPVFS